MACDWIKMRVDLYRDPKVCVIADCLMAPDGPLAAYVSQMKQRDMTVTRNVTRNVTVGALVTVWGVMRHRGKRREDSLLCKGVTISVIDDVADLPGFGAAMASVGWAVQTDEGIEFPGFFEEYNVDPSEKKASAAAERQRRYRERKASNGDVTRDVTVTHREEKSREEKKKKDQEPLSGTIVPDCPHLEIVKAYNELLPQLPQVRESLWNGTRATHLKARWRDNSDFQTVEAWRDFFIYVAGCPHLMGENDRAWTADLGWLVNPTNFAKVVEGKYERR